jgi:hypothetical protein
MRKGKWKISLKSLVSVRWHNHLPRLIIHEKYENHVKWTLCILFFAGIGLSLFVFTPYLAFPIAALIGLTGLFFQKAIFQYTTIYIQPMPDFKYDPKEWKSMVFGFAPSQKLLNFVGCAFSTEKTAHNFFKLLKSWNYDKNEDKDNNICISFIVENEKEYSVYLYPNSERKTIDESFHEVEESRKYEKYGKKHQQLIMHMVFYNTFPYDSNSQLKQFIKKQSSDCPFWLKCFAVKEDGQPKWVSEDAILKFNFKFKCRKELQKNEVEYWHKKTV